VVPPGFVSDPTIDQDISLGLLTEPSVRPTCLPAFRSRLAGGFHRWLLEQAFSPWPVLSLSAAAAFTRPGHHHLLSFVYYMPLWEPVKLGIGSPGSNNDLINPKKANSFAV